MPACKPPRQEREVLRLTAGDTLVIQCDDMLTNHQHNSIKTHAMLNLPEGVKVLVLGNGLRVAATATAERGHIPPRPIPQPRDV